jgi:NADH pyrophosphatase NudC (nudix superfamily)
MLKLLELLKTAYPEVKFTPGERFVWSPETEEVIYKSGATNEQDKWALLHETGHALLHHKTYHTDIELLKMEIEAWEKARELGQVFAITIDENHIQDCLDTYRDWLHARAICPTCTTRCLQQDNGRSYRCHNCHTSWNVTPSRFCRPYRSTQSAEQSVVLFAASL